MSARHGFRPDIEGLRTIAIVSVVLYHAGVPSLSGGFVGVDLFFVLSGFLITGMLVRELELSGRISLRDFWARRVRRLLPAATTVLILIGLCSFMLMPATVRTDTAMAIVASTVYVANWFFAANSLDYLNAEEAPSPVLHFWSLGVEEQFYVLWPVLLLAIVVAVKRLHLRPRPALAAFAGIVWIGSFAASLYYSEASQPIAFFSSPTRFWQLATGALLALATPAIRRQRRDVLMGAQIIGMVVLLYAIVETGALIEHDREPNLHGGTRRISAVRSRSRNGRRTRTPSGNR